MNAVISLKKINYYLNHIWIFFVALFGISLMTSKSGITLTSTILIIWAFVSRSQRAVWMQDKKVLFLISLFPLAIFLNLFSLNGWESSLKVITSWPWPLIAAPTLVIFGQPQARKTFIYALGLGLLISCLYSIYLLAQHFIYQVDIPFMTSNFRIRSFWDSSRWGFFTGFFVLVLSLLYYEKLEHKFKSYLLPSLVLFSIVFLLSNTRGPLLSLFLILTLVSLTKARAMMRKQVALAIFIVFLGFVANKTAFERLTSIFAVQIDGAQITSKDPSNAGRLHMWKVAIDFFQEQPWFGSGFESTTEPLKKFIENKSSAYTDTFTKVEFSYNDQHSSYLSSLIQMGLIFFVICWGGILIIFTSGFKNYLKSKENAQLYYLAGLAYCFIILIFYSSFNSYESILLFILLTLISKEKSAKVVSTNI